MTAPLRTFVLAAGLLALSFAFAAVAGAQGPVGPVVDLTEKCGYDSRLLQLGDGTWVALWTQESTEQVWGRRGNDPGSLGLPTPLTATGAAYSTAVAQPSGFAVGYYHHPSGQAQLQFFDASFGVVSGPIVLGETDEPPPVAARADGETVVAWANNGEVRARRFSAAGLPLGDAIEVGVGGGWARPQVAFGESSFLVIWRGEGFETHVRAFGPAGNPLGEDRVIFDHFSWVPPVASGERFLLASLGSPARTLALLADGSPVGPPEDLPLIGLIDDLLRLAASGERVWAAAVIDRRVYGVELDPQNGRALSGAPTLLAVRQEGTHGIAEIALAPAGGDLALAWLNYTESTQIGNICFSFTSSQATVVGPLPLEGVVDVPAQGSAGVLLFALALAIAAAWRLRG